MIIEHIHSQSKMNDPKIYILVLIELWGLEENTPIKKIWKVWHFFKSKKS